MRISEDNDGMKAVYFNQMQLEVLQTDAHTSVVVGGRGIGKGALQAAQLLQSVQRMPRGTFAFVTPTGKRALTNTLPSITRHLETWGYKQGVHWCIGVRPPKRLGWAEPLMKTQHYEYFLSFYNGAQVHIVSQDRQGTSNSMSYDYIFIDEAKFVNFERLKDETFPANRGQGVDFGHVAQHHGMLITSDMPTSKKGSWFMNYKGESDAELVAVVQGLVHRQWEVGAHLHLHPDDAKAQREVRRIARELETLRRYALFYKEYSSLVNLAVLGEAFFAQMKRDLPPLTFLTSIMCVMPKRTEGGFYASLTDENLYTEAEIAEQTDLVGRYGYGAAAADAIADEGAKLDSDVSENLPLCIAFDYNANINWLVVGQVHGDELRVVRSFFVKYERKLRELVDDFAAYYRYHKERIVYFCYDSTALGSNYAVNRDDFKQVIIDRLLHYGFYAVELYVGRPMAHNEKHLLLNAMLAGHRRYRPRINEEAAHDLLLSITGAGVYNGSKDKRGEKLAETEEDRLEYRTDGSDAFDTLCIAIETRYQEGMVGMYLGGGIG